MEIEGRRRSSNFEDRGRGGGGGGGGLPINALSTVVRLLGVKGTLVVGAIAGIGYFLVPQSLRQALLRAVGGSGVDSSPAQGSGSVCQASAGNGKACNFSR